MEPCEVHPREGAEWVGAGHQRSQVLVWNNIGFYRRMSSSYKGSKNLPEREETGGPGVCQNLCNHETGTRYQLCFENLMESVIEAELYVGENIDE